MQVVYPICAGIDVHKKTAVVCLRDARAGGQAVGEVRTFNTTTRSLLEMLDWLTAVGCTHVAMESTGVYWKPIFNLLEGVVEVILVNAQHIKAVPGRKTDVKDSEWIADLLQHGLLRGSFIPPREIRELRDLVRTRTTLLRDRAREINRIQKVLETANIKLASVASDVSGVSGRLMLKAMITGQSDPGQLSELARGRLRSKRKELHEALYGQVTEHHRFLLRHHLQHIEFLEQSIAEYDVRIEQAMAPFASQRDRLDQITGVGPEVATIIISEMGVDMSPWPTHRHAASWAGICPGQKESAGKRKSGRMRKANPWLRAALLQAGWAASHTKDTYLSAQHRRITVRRGAKKAAIAVGHSILVRSYHMLKDGTDYQEAGGAYFDERDRERIRRRLIRRLEALGLNVSVEERAA